MKALDQADVLSARDLELLHELKGIIRGFVPTATILLYGSVARGAANAESDYDILVLTDQPLSRQDEDRVERVVYDLQLRREVLLETLYCTKAKWNTPLMRVSPFYAEVDRDGIEL